MNLVAVAVSAGNEKIEPVDSVGVLVRSHQLSDGTVSARGIATRGVGHFIGQRTPGLLRFCDSWVTICLNFDNDDTAVLTISVEPPPIRSARKHRQHDGLGVVYVAGVATSVSRRVMAVATKALGQFLIDGCFDYRLGLGCTPRQCPAPAPVGFSRGTGQRTRSYPWAPSGQSFAYGDKGGRAASLATLRVRGNFASFTALGWGRSSDSSERTLGDCLYGQKQKARQLNSGHVDAR